MRFRFLLTFVCAVVAFHTVATVRYVDLNNSNPIAPFSDWSSAATNIQDAIDAASDGDQIWVTNGTYAIGGKAMVSTQTNRVSLDKALTVQSVNGPYSTIIEGAGATNGPSAVRCAWLTNGAALIGFTLRGGAIQAVAGSQTFLNGGGAWCAASNAVLGNCIITGNTALQYGGGVFQGTAYNCFISSNSCSANGSGATDCILNNCTIVGNTRGGTYQSFPNRLQATNCIIFYNSSGNFGGGSYSHCCAIPGLAGNGNFTNAPLLFADNVRLTPASPCIGAGLPPLSGTDLFGKAWASTPSVGCAEYDPSPAVTDPRIQLTGDPAGFTVGVSGVNGQPPLTFQWLLDGAPIATDSHFNSSQTTNLIAIGVHYADAAGYQLVVSNASGVVTSAVAKLVIHCVDAAVTNPVAPYSTWATAATNIQDAVDAAAQGEVVLVTNGLYATGTKSMDGASTNRVAVDKPILVQSVKGPFATIIQGAWDPVSTNGPGAVRCVWLTNNAIVSGFTLRGGATPGTNGSGGGAWGSSTNATVANCYLLTNYASFSGGGAYQATLKNCVLTDNHAVGSGRPGVGQGGAGAGGGAAFCTLKDCRLSNNFAEQSEGGGAFFCALTGCALMKNSSYMNGGAARSGLLVNCTVSENISSGYSPGYGAAVYGAVVSNSIIWGNFQRTSFPNTNYASCTVSQSCTDPIAPGPGNIGLDPQLLLDGVHLAESSPCIGAATNGVAQGADIDGQPWNIPPSMGCDEWHPAPLIGSQPGAVVNSPPHGLTLGVVPVGQSPLLCYWSHNGLPIQDDAHYHNSSTDSLLVNSFGPDDAGTYQVVVSNAFGLATSELAQVVIHVVDAASVNPVAPYFSWATAAATIQEAIDAASAGDIVLVTNGLYLTGGKAIGGTLTNRVALDKPLTVLSVNGYGVTVIEGAWGSPSTNGPGAVRCAWLTDGAVLSGFTLRHGATQARTGLLGAPLESGGGAWCVSSNGVVSNCLLTNNWAIYGGGFSQGTLKNSLVTYNVADYGGGAFGGTLVNCTLIGNFTTNPFFTRNQGAGTYNSIARNSIVLRNYDGYPNGIQEDNFGASAITAQYLYCCTSPSISGGGNINADPLFIDLFHVASSSPCRAAGNALYATGADLDGETWLNPPSIGCDEVIPADLIGPLSLDIVTSGGPNLLLNHSRGFGARLTGRASSFTWGFGDGATITNTGNIASHTWTNTGDYILTATAFNTDHPQGISTNLTVHVLPLAAPLMASVLVSSNNMVFQFGVQPEVLYAVQYATNLAPPVTWQTLQFVFSSDPVYQITDPVGTNSVRFYRLRGQ